MAPVEARIGGEFVGRISENGGGEIKISRKPPHFLRWTGDGSEKPEVSVYKLDEETGKTTPIITGFPLRRIGDWVSTTIELFEKAAPPFPNALIPTTAELLIRRTK